MRGGFLLNGNRRGEPFDMIDIGLLHHRQELPGIGRKRFDVATLTLSVQSVKSQRRFSRTGQASYYDEFVARYGEINVF